VRDDAALLSGRERGKTEMTGKRQRDSSRRKLFSLIPQMWRSQGICQQKGQTGVDIWIVEHG